MHPHEALAFHFGIWDVVLMDNNKMPQLFGGFTFNCMLRPKEHVQLYLLSCLSVRNLSKSWLGLSEKRTVTRCTEFKSFWQRTLEEDAIPPACT